MSLHCEIKLQYIIHRNPKIYAGETSHRPITAQQFDARGLSRDLPVTNTLRSRACNHVTKRDVTWPRLEALQNKLTQFTGKLITKSFNRCYVNSLACMTTSWQKCIDNKWCIGTSVLFEVRGSGDHLTNLMRAYYFIAVSIWSETRVFHADIICQICITNNTLL